MTEIHKIIENLTHTGNVVKSIKGKLQHIEKKISEAQPNMFKSDEDFKEGMQRLVVRCAELKTELILAYHNRDIARSTVDELFASMRG